MYAEDHKKVINACRTFFASCFKLSVDKMETWTSNCPDVPIQIGDYDCGLMTCLNLAIISKMGTNVKDIAYKVNAKNFSEIRRKMLAYELIKGELIFTL